MSQSATSEVHALQGRAAGLVSRSAADAADLILVIATVCLGYLGLAAVRLLIAPVRFQWPNVSGLMLIVLGMALLIVYLAAAWSGTGRSLGKQVMGLRVERLDGAPLPVGRAFVRALLCAVFPLGLVLVVFSSRNASLQDLLVGTKVVYDWLPRVPVRGEFLAVGREGAAPRSSGR